MSAGHEPKKRILAVSKPLSKLLADLEKMERVERDRAALLSTKSGIIAAAVRRPLKEEDFMPKENRIKFRHLLNPVILIKEGYVDGVDGIDHYTIIDLNALKFGYCPICEYTDMDDRQPCQVCGFKWPSGEPAQDLYPAIVQRHREYLQAKLLLKELEHRNLNNRFRLRWCEDAEEITVQVEDWPGQWLCLHQGEEEESLSVVPEKTTGQSAGGAV